MILSSPNPLDIQPSERVRLKGDPHSPVMTVANVVRANQHGTLYVAILVWFGPDSLQPYNMQIDVKALERVKPETEITQ